jgi:hypothetical protein
MAPCNSPLFAISRKLIRSSGNFPQDERKCPINKFERGKRS